MSCCRQRPADAATDLIAPVNPDSIFPCGDVPALGGLLRRMLSDETKLARRGHDTVRRMKDEKDAVFGPL
jgi:hypothetical protein